MAGLIEDLGAGLQGAGAVLSDEVYKTQAVERQNRILNIARTLEITKAQKAMQADEKVRQALNGKIHPGMTSSAMLESIDGIDQATLAESAIGQNILKTIEQKHQHEVQSWQKAESLRLAAERAENMRIQATKPTDHFDAQSGNLIRSYPDGRTEVLPVQQSKQVPKERKRIAGDQEIQEEWDQASQSWKEVGRGPRFARQVAPVIHVSGGGKSEASPLNSANADVHGDDFLNKIPQADRVSVKALLDYDMDPKTIPPRMIEVDGRKQSRREYLIGLARQVDPTYSETAYREKTTALNEFQRTKGNAVRFLNVSIDHIDTAAEYAKALKNGNVQMLNRIKNEIQTQWGVSAPNTFEGIKDIVASEVIKGAIGGPGGVEERRENAAKVKAANSPEQLDELFKGWKKLMAGQMKGLEKAYESGTRMKNFREKYMLPRARAALEEVSGDESPTNPPAKPGGGGKVLRFDAQGNLIP